MGLSNLPPGVTDSMIPGNRPEDAAAEAFYDELDDKCMEFNCPYLDERLVAWLWEKVSSGAH